MFDFILEFVILSLMHNSCLSLADVYIPEAIFNQTKFPNHDYIALCGCNSTVSNKSIGCKR